MTGKQARLDLQGGLAGDMFVAAMIDAMPELKPLVPEVLAALPLPEGTIVDLVPHHDGMFGGHQLSIELPSLNTHTSWRQIEQMIRQCALNSEARSLAISIFRALAKVEAEIHNKAIADVVFHEVGAWDSIIDIVLAAALISASGIENWSVSPIPLGSGLIHTRHGQISAPAPATRLLLQSFECVDDGIPGERVTPTGAAILKSIIGTKPVRGRLMSTGSGFGQKRLTGTSNCVWLSIFDTKVAVNSVERIVQLSFEIDDATPEELAIGLDHIRVTEGVIDVTEMAAWGKKGRHVHAVCILGRPEHTEAIVESCFHQTSTLGLRIIEIERRILPRRLVQGTDGTGVKVATRPNGVKTAKAESHDIAGEPDHKSRQNKASSAVNEALKTSD